MIFIKTEMSSNEDSILVLMKKYLITDTSKKLLTNSEKIS